MIHITSFYKFTAISKEELNSKREELLQSAKNNHVGGLILLSAEGYNATVAGKKENLDSFMDFFKSILDTSDVIFKDSTAPRIPFKRFKVDLRNEIITFEGDHLPAIDEKSHLSPSEWHKVILDDKDAVVIDTRNIYETKLGKFKSALDPNIKVFSQFPEWVKNQNFSKEQKLLIYCTGGVRCEKAAVALQKEGYKNVFQLDGGILKYLEEYPNQGFEGECFVFDHRVSVKQDLSPSENFSLCPLCGDPADQLIECGVCSKDMKICEDCKRIHPVCSKNCKHHYKRKNAEV